MLLLILILSTLALFALLWGGSLIAQGYFYNEPTSHLPYRALAAAVLMAVFLTFWVWLDRRAPGKYGTFFEFSPYTTTTFNEFEAMRWRAVPGSGAAGKKLELMKGPDGKPVETVLKIRRKDGNKQGPFVTPENKEFVLQEGGAMTGALSVKLPDSEAPVRFNADVKEDPRVGTLVYETPDRRFTEDRGSRYILGNQMGIVYIPSTGAVFVALFVNLLHFVLWLVALWLILRFSFGHALLFAIILGLTTMLVAMPLLFKPHRAAPAAQAATMREMRLVRAPISFPSSDTALKLQNPDSPRESRFEPPLARC